jgi:ABC-type glycerol-3-phosphate transport system permease component
LIPVFLELKALHLLGSQAGLILLYVGTSVPFALFIMRTFFENLPGELADAARIDGASELKTFWRVMLPLAAPGIAAIAIIQVLSTWNELMFANALIQQTNLLPLQPVLYSLVGQYSTNWPALTAALTVAVVPIVAVYVFLQRWFIIGITAGAVKG